MAEVIETESRFNEFLQHYNDFDGRVLVDAVQTRSDVDPARSSVCFVFVRIGDREVVLPVSHIDASCLNPKLLLELNTGVDKFCLSKKRILHLVPFRNLVDCSLLYYFQNNEPPILSPTEVPPKTNNNRYRPLTKLAGVSQNRLDRCERILDEDGSALDKRPFRKYNGDMLETFFRLERHGICVDPTTFEATFGSRELLDEDSLVYSNYNFYTSTGRPSNANGGVNYAALDPEEREVFVSRFDDGVLLNADYDGFHLRLVSDLIGYNAPDESFHKHLGHLYFDKEELTEDEYKESKELTFRLIYNPWGMPDEVLELDFFRGVKDLTERIWDVYERYGLISTPLYRRQMTASKIDNFNPAKAFNYTIQAYETEYNTERIKKIFNELSDMRSVPTLYTYDSILFDCPKDEVDEVKSKVRNIMSDDVMKVKISVGSTMAEATR